MCATVIVLFKNNSVDSKYWHQMTPFSPPTHTHNDWAWFKRLPCFGGILEGSPCFLSNKIISIKLQHDIHSNLSLQCNKDDI